MRWGKTSGSLNIGTQDNGPWVRYVCKKVESAWFLLFRGDDVERIASSRMTVSGDSNPCAVRKDGKVSQLAKTEFDNFVLVDRSFDFCCTIGFFTL